MSSVPIHFFSFARGICIRQNQRLVKSLIEVGFPLVFQTVCCTWPIHFIKTVATLLISQTMKDIN